MNESITDCRECTLWLLDARGYGGNTGEMGICLKSGMAHSCHPLTPCEAGTRKPILCSCGCGRICHPTPRKIRINKTGRYFFEKACQNRYNREHHTGKGQKQQRGHVKVKNP